MPQERVSIITATYNRAAVLARAIDSVVRQDYSFWELLIVDDGSTDETQELLRGYKDERITVLTHSENRGVSAAKNTGLDHMSGEWFTFLDSDDEAVPHALSEMLAVVEMHPDVDAVTCNCLDSVTREFTGFGLDQEGYVDARAVANAGGEYWGITRTRLLGRLRFNERISGGEAAVWLKISARAVRYYIDRGLRVYHREGADRVSRQSRERQNTTHLLMARDDEYLSLLKELAPERHAEAVFRTVVAAVDSGERATAWRFLRRYDGSVAKRVFLLSACAFGRPWLAVVRMIRARLARP